MVVAIIAYFANHYRNFSKLLKVKRVILVTLPVGTKLVTKLKLSVSHLRGHRSGYNFKNKLNPLSPCIIEAETGAYYLLYCHFYNEN